jgi:hypothetical protein
MRVMLHSTPGVLAPVWVFCPSPSSLIRPHPPHSQAHRDFAALRLILDALAVRLRLGDPRVVPHFHCLFCIDMSSSETTESPLAACAQFLRQRRWPSPRLHRLGTFKVPHHPLLVGQGFSELDYGSLALRPVELLAPLSDRTGLCSSQPTRAFTSRLPAARSPSPLPDITTVATEQSPPAGLTPARNIS